VLRTTGALVPDRLLSGRVQGNLCGSEIGHVRRESALALPRIPRFRDSDPPEG
jgi:hypothetical protein